MKKLIPLFIVCLAAVTARAQSTAEIRAQIKNLPAGEWVYFYPLYDNLGKDSIQSTAGGFSCHIHLTEAQPYVIRIGSAPAENSIVLLEVEKGTTLITGSGPLFKDAVLSGTRAAADYQDYKSAEAADPVLKDRSEVYRQYNDLYKKKDSAGMTALEPTLQKLDSVSQALTKRWISSHHSSPVSAFLLSYSLFQLPLETKDSILKTLTPAARDNASARRIVNSVRINDLTSIGKAAPGFTQNDTLGHPVSLKDFRGKYVLVDFWASWCMPCRAENPNVVAAYAKYKDHNFTVIGISLDRPGNKDAWLKAIHADHLAWTQLSDLKWWNNAVAKAYDINSIPSNVLIDPDGKIIAKDLHGEELEKELSKILGLHAGSFTISGTIGAVRSPVIRLYYTSNTGKRVVDSSFIRNGHFSFHGEAAEPESAFLSIAAPNTAMTEKNGIHFYIENAGMRITVPGDDLSKAVITGSATEDEYRTLKAAQAPILKAMEPLSARFKKANEAYMAAIRAQKPEAELDTLKYRAAAIHDAFEPYQARLAQLAFQFFESHPESYVTANELRYYTATLSLDSLKLFYSRLGTAVQQGQAGKEIAAEIEKLQAGSPGSMAADFAAPDLRGDTFRLSSLRGKYVLIDFWASWCVPCRKSMPHVKELYALYKDKGLDVVAVSDDDSKPAAWRHAIEKDGTGEWHNVLRGLNMEKRMKNESNPEDISEKFGISELPTKILIDPGGKIIGRYDKGTDEEAAALDRQLAAAFGGG
jgi:thiol-disulfide isomerase/thioredoxin